VRELTAIDALTVYEDALLGAPEGGGALHAVGEDGSRRLLPLGRWLGTPDAAEETVLERASGPVLDIGCGVGRHVVALRRRGIRAVGVEISPVAATIARERGAEVIQASAFEHPTTSEWRTILLLDGNIGIGGDATRLLRRSAALLVPGGAVLVELEEPAGAPRAQRVRLEGARAASSWIPWHFVGYEEIDLLAASSGFEPIDRWRAGDRWFAELRLAASSQKSSDSAQKCELTVGAPAGETMCRPPD
jgi:SAM-dependent methyltransferase